VPTTTVTAPSPGASSSTTSASPTTQVSSVPQRQRPLPLPHLLVLARNATGDGRVYQGVAGQVLDRILAEHRWLGRAVLLVRSQAVVVVVVGAKY
jgi:hypothetical protein